MTSIIDLTATTTPALADQLPVYSSQGGDTKRMGLSQLRDFLQANLTFLGLNMSQQYAAPSASGFSVAIGSSDTWLILTPVAGYAAGTIVLPASPVNEQEIIVNCTQSVTALTVSGNGKTVTGAPTTLAANAFFRLRFDGVTNAWYRVG